MRTIPGIGRPAPFWILQLGGWSLYALDRYLSERSFFPVYFIYLCVAFALSTCLLRPIYRSVYRRGTGPAALLVTGVTASLLAAVLWLIVSRIVFTALGLMRPPPLSMGYLVDTVRTTLVHHKPFLFLSWSGIYFGVKLWTDARDRRAGELEAIALAQQAELHTLRAQLDPHFVFNALNSTSALIRQDPVRAERLVDEIASFLRHSLTAASDRAIPLAEEIASVRAYLDIQQIRYERQLETRVDISETALQWPIPPLLLQPLVENAVKHGMRTSAAPLKVRVTGGVRDGRLTLDVTHTGRLLAETGKGVGLANVRRRLALALPGRHEFALRECNGEVQATITIAPLADAACAP
jgi:two-component system, LytTR family, sensor kinase